MTTSHSMKLGASASAALPDDRFTVTRVKTAPVTADSANIVFRVVVNHRHCGQKVFCGLLDRDLKSGAGLSIDTETGEVVDLINGQGIIGFIDACPLPEGKSIAINLTMDKFGSTHICTAEIAGEQVIYPAVLLDGVDEIGAVLGSTDTDGDVEFSKASLIVDPA